MSCDRNTVWLFSFQCILYLSATSNRSLNCLCCVEINRPDLITKNVSTREFVTPRTRMSVKVKNLLEFAEREGDHYKATVISRVVIE